ncbi:hypothetical protein ACEQPO_27280 [Bacillus sp. SL00103]
MQSLYLEKKSIISSVNSIYPSDRWLMPLASVWIIQTLINEIILFMTSSGDIQKVLWLFGLQMVIVVLGYGLQFILFQLSQQKATNLIGLHLKGEFTQKAIRLPYITFEHPSFIMKVNVMNSHQHVLSMVGRAIFTIMSALITVVSLLIYMIGIHWGLGGYSDLMYSALSYGLSFSLEAHGIN